MSKKQRTVLDVVFVVFATLGLNHGMQGSGQDRAPDIGEMSVDTSCAEWPETGFCFPDNTEVRGELR